MRSLKFRLATVLVWAALLPGCATLNWYGHLAGGQARLLLARQPVSELLDSKHTDPALHGRLEYAQRVIRFAEDVLMLPVAGQYSDYVDTGRERAVWALFAAPEFSLQAREWCYPLIGCASYRGFFRRTLAEDEQARLAKEGFDTWIGGVRAYSTLGWFNDPLLNTFIHLDSTELAALLFHELAHQVMFVADDTGFNESFASFVEREGLRQWLEAQGQTAEYTKYLHDEAMRDRFHEIVAESTRQLEGLYRTRLGTDQMRGQKTALLNNLRAAYADEVRTNPAFRMYEGWFEGPLNNAKLSTVHTYQQWVPEFGRLFNESDQDFARFYAAVQKLAKLDKSSRHAQLLKVNN